jgi:hypothetical protein
VDHLHACFASRIGKPLRIGQEFLRAVLVPMAVEEPILQIDQQERRFARSGKTLNLLRNGEPPSARSDWTLYY